MIQTISKALLSFAIFASVPAFAAELRCQHDGLTLTGNLNDIGQIEQLTVADTAGHVRFHSDAPIVASVIQNGNYTFVLQDGEQGQQSVTIPPTFGQFDTSEIYYVSKEAGVVQPQAQAPVAFVCPTKF